MSIAKEIREILRATAVIKSPKHRLATFGQSRIRYVFLSAVAGFEDRSRVREGTVVAENPKIVTPELLRNRFQGFGRSAKAYGEWLLNSYGPSFRGLEYRFRNEARTSRLEYSQLRPLTQRMRERMASDRFDQFALIQGPDKPWQISLMKFVLDECAASFAGNLRELDEHGYFDATPPAAAKAEIESFFAKAKRDPALVPLLGKKLRQYGLFKEYEDRFFQLFSR